MFFLSSSAFSFFDNTQSYFKNENQRKCNKNILHISNEMCFSITIRNKNNLELKVES